MSDVDFEMISNYDAQADALFLKVKKPYSYKESVELADNVILDFSEDNIPVALEILDASKYFHVKPFSLRNFNFEMTIDVKKDTIHLEAVFMFLIHQKKENRPVDLLTLNDMKIPSMQTNYAVV
jgi:uncharacterized protein YuzE